MKRNSPYGPLYCRGSRILALPPARKGSDMVDKCAPRARAQNQPSTSEKIKSILLLSVMCSLFAPRETPAVHSKQTRNPNVIFPPFADQTETNKIKTNHHNTVFFNAKHGIHIPMHRPRGLGPPPLRNISSRQIQGLSEPPCGLRPCASPQIYFQTKEFQATKKKRTQCFRPS